MITLGGRTKAPPISFSSTSGCLGEAAAKDVQPKAVAVPLAGLPEGCAALQVVKLDGLAGDSILLATTLRGSVAQGFELVPQQHCWRAPSTASPRPPIR